MLSHLIMKQQKVNVSFEFFPPKNEGAISSLWNNINRLEPLKPRFISVTYGAGGSTRENTHDLVKQIKKKIKELIMQQYIDIKPLMSNP